MRESTRNRINYYSKIIIVITGIIGVISVIIEYGFNLPEKYSSVLHYTAIGVVVFFIFYQFVQLSLKEKKLEYLKSRKIEFLITFLILLEFFLYLFGFSVVRRIGLALKFQNIALLYIIALQFIIIIEFFLGGLRYNSLILQSKIHPARLFVLSFIMTILIGALFLMLPKATVHQNITFMDALFTSTSAVCVTGLTVFDTATYFTRFGQTVILILIQIGGLGLVTFTTFFAIFLAGGLGLRERFMLQDLLGEQNVSQIGRIIAIVIFVTLGIELIGAVLLFQSISIYAKTFEEAVYISVFHSISAFCNAGFSVFSLNLMDPMIRNNYYFNTVISLLIIVGGLGYPTIINIFSKRIFASIPEKVKNRITLQTRMVILSTILLIILGAVLTYYCDYYHSLNNLNTAEKIFHSYFQSVSARTAGYNTVDISQFSVSTTLVYLFLMFVGASPGGTGGGIKTTTLMIIILSFWSFLRNDKNVNFGKRSINNLVVLRALLKGIFTLFIITLGVFLLTITDANKILLDISFEAFSAFGTVGLSRGITPLLSYAGKMVIITLMFIGRIGPLTFMFSIIKAKDKVDFDYPSEEISTV